MPANSATGLLPEAVQLPGTVHIVGAGRMGEGIARAFAFAGIHAVIIYVKKRTPSEAAAYAQQVHANLAAATEPKVDRERINAEQSAMVLDRISLLGVGESDAELKAARLVFEAVPEVLEIKAATFAWLCSVVSDDCLLASTSSSFPVTEMAALVRPSVAVAPWWGKVALTSRWSLACGAFPGGVWSCLPRSTPVQPWCCW